MSKAATIGADVRLRFTKWGDRSHWEVTLEMLGEDLYGAWLGGRAGVEFTRPGVSFETTGALVVLVPHDRPWVATFYGGKDFGHIHDCLVYVDMTTSAVWSPDGADVTMVDLDLDVFQRHDGSVHVDDEDEFATHQVEMAYPPEIIALAEGSRDEVLHAIRDGIAPFDDATGSLWLAKLA
jgi:hypothetical protein